ncbi:MAG: beta-lactamase family protein [Gemmatimonadota bacterium]|nr:MAG: beta-lactamase family protein [Gemmatimonadota bacterium]
MVNQTAFIRTPARACVAALLLACNLACDSSPTEPAGPVEVVPMEGLEGFEAELDSLRVELQIPGISAAIAKDGEIVWSMGFGYADAEEGRPATPTTPYHLASLTKPFAATIVMQLIEDGLVDLDDPVSQYGVDLEADGVIRVRHLLTHTSEGVPGSHYAYNGGRFAELDRVIRVATGRTFGELLVERILQPLQLSHTAPNPRHRAFYLTGLDRDAFVAEMAAGYELRGSEVYPMGQPTHFSSAAGLVASAEDVATFSLAIDDGQFLEPETWGSVFTPAVSNTGETLPYGFGWFIHYHEGAKLEWHYGYWDSNSSLIVRAPETGMTFVVLGNTNMLSRPYGLGLDSNVMRSDVARLFVESFVLGDEPLPGG